MMSPTNREEQQECIVSATDDAHQKQELQESKECPSKEELADLAAGLCSSERRESLKQHFTICKTCYDDWVALCFEMAAMSRGSSQRKLRTFTRILGCLGLVGVMLVCAIFLFAISP